MAMGGMMVVSAFSVSAHFPLFSKPDDHIVHTTAGDLDVRSGEQFDERAGGAAVTSGETRRHVQVERAVLADFSAGHRPA